ncbi:aminotransferase class III-fold pyridoxal phosphate-dependent enzyme [Bifidobacterium sp. SMB2]|uniref:Aminotransferase class III-fold pyridoxal phosphate-dependent enzyme n=2 Tax=Bifidobacterium TaxID=1678 RepID=A0ABX0CJT9_9BIFI|nr:aminotransferase class III-fold pyridoxal phosphate-dependent enzyme [Bifidobacterium sp. SMB2]NEH12527.1 aminotransferase class III-fold pyridoxal phosphate-dependent enzyme [Bifidobacterium saimiriisciurei]
MKRMVNSFDPTKGAADLTPDEAALLARRQRTLGSLAPVFYEHPVHIVRGEGAHLFAADGTDYLDCYNNVAVVGHANPHVREAVADQLTRQDTHTRYLQDEVVDYAERLLATFPDKLDHVAFTNSGSESNDLALRMARTFTGHRGVVVTGNAYHGITSLVSSVSPSFGTGLPLAPFLVAVPVDDILKKPDGTFDDHAVAAAARAELVARFEAAFAKLHDAGYGVSAVLLDQIFSSDGVLPGATGWVADVADAVHQAGGLLIADEVQSGFARTGERFWGFRRHRADADIVTMGKPMGNGIPTGAVVYKHEIGDTFAACTRYFNTFGGNPVSMRAASAVLDEIESRELQRHARELGDHIAAEIARLLADAPRFGGIRHAGLFIGIDILAADDSRTPDPYAAARIIAALRDRRVLISGSAADGSSLKLRPPLVFTRSDADRLLTELAAIAPLFG